MGWDDTWKDIADGGSQRWKVMDSSAHATALGHIKRYVKDTSSILCPLAGDDPMARLLWEQGYSVTAIDLVPVALERMRQQFGEGEWTKTDSSSRDDGMVVWKHSSGRATQYQGDALASITELKGTFDCVYDKDSFGALDISMRQAYCDRIAEYTKEGEAVVYIEVKLSDVHDDVVKRNGPPFSLEKEDLMDSLWYGNAFTHIESLGSVYPVAMPNVKQTGHILKRK